jgi:hypothetical protein
VVATVALTARAAAQFPPDSTKNLQVLPEDLPVRAVIDTMRSFTRALGVRCTYCHVGREGEPLTSYDFVADKKPEKERARAMLQMVAAINDQHLGKLPDRRSPTIAVTCFTCHRGVPQPRPIQQVVLTTYDAAGADSAIALYRALRERYFGRAAYDFGEVPLVDVAEALRGRDRAADAVRFYKLNVELQPSSGFALRQAAEGMLAAGDTGGARSSLEKALALNANDPQAKRMLDRLSPKPPSP